MILVRLLLFYKPVSSGVRGGGATWPVNEGCHLVIVSCRYKPSLPLLPIVIPKVGDSLLLMDRL